MNWKEELDLQRERRRLLIIDAAEQVFLKKGLQHTMMTDIAAQANISRPTLYKYFKTIDELAFEVQIRALGLIFETFSKNLESDEPAITRFKILIDNLIESFTVNTNHIQFSSLFDYYYQSQYPNPVLEKRYAEFLNQCSRVYETLLLAGQKDGSIRKDLDIHNTDMLIGNLMIGTMQRLALRGQILQKEQNIHLNAQLKELGDMIINYIQYPPISTSSPIPQSYSQERF